MAVDIVDQSLCGNDLLHELGECLSLEALAGGEIFDHAGIEVYLDFIAIVDLAGCLWTLNDGQPDIDGIAVEDSGKGLGDDAADACRLDGDGGMLSGGAAAEVFLRYDNVTFFHIFDKVLVNILHAVSRQFCWVGRIQVSCGNDNICIHVPRI